MAGVRFSAQTGEIASGTGAKTLLQVIAAANHRVLIREITVSFKGTSATAAPVKVDVLRLSDAGTMSGLTPVKINPADDETLQTTAQHTATAEPTAGDVIKTEEVHPQTGLLWQAPFGGEIVVPGGTRLAIRVTAAADVNSVARIEGEE